MQNHYTCVFCFIFYSTFYLIKFHCILFKCFISKLINCVIILSGFSNHSVGDWCHILYCFYYYYILLVVYFFILYKTWFLGILFIKNTSFSVICVSVCGLIMKMQHKLFYGWICLLNDRVGYMVFVIFSFD